MRVTKLFKARRNCSSEMTTAATLFLLLSKTRTFAFYVYSMYLLLRLHKYYIDACSYLIILSVSSLLLLVLV